MSLRIRANTQVQTQKVSSFEPAAAKEGKSAAPAPADHFLASTAPKAQPKAAAPTGISPKRLPPTYKRWFNFVKAAAHKFKLRVSTLFGIMQRESNGRNVRGDGGHGRGLMQIDDRTWGSWLRTHKGGMDPRSNIMKGAAILRQNLNFFKGKIAASRVRRAAIAAYNAGPGTVLSAIRRGRSVDSVTTGGNYSRDVVAKANRFAKLLRR